MKTAILYHDADFDGLLSRDVCLHVHPNATPIGWDYGRPEPDLSEFSKIYIVDLSLPLATMERYRDRIVWIDHHQTAIAQLEHLQLPGLRLDGVAACRLCWQFFFGSSAWKEGAYVDRLPTEPLLLTLAGEHDIWDHRDPRTKPLQFGLRALNEDQWRELVRAEFLGQPSGLDRVIENGQLLEEYGAKQAFEYGAKNSHGLQWEGLYWQVLNTSFKGSGQFDSLTLGCHQGLFSWRFNGKNVEVSLYHAPGNTDRDLSAIAKKYGGGGHRGACGFRLSLVQLAAILEGKEKG